MADPLAADGTGKRKSWLRVPTLLKSSPRKQSVAFSGTSPKQPANSELRPSLAPSAAPTEAAAVTEGHSRGSQSDGVVKSPHAVLARSRVESPRHLPSPSLMLQPRGDLLEASRLLGAVPLEHPDSDRDPDINPDVHHEEDDADYNPDLPARAGDVFEAADGEGPSGDADTRSAAAPALSSILSHGGHDVTPMVSSPDRISSSSRGGSLMASSTLGAKLSSALLSHQPSQQHLNQQQRSMIRSMSWAQPSAAADVRQPLSTRLVHDLQLSHESLKTERDGE